MLKFIFLMAENFHDEKNLLLTASFHRFYVLKENNSKVYIDV